MALTQFGEKTKSVFLKGVESNKIHQEFEVKAGSSVIKGQPLVLNTDGTVLPAAAGAKSFTVIGYALHTRATGELVTVAMKAYAIVWGQSLGALNAGPVKVGAAPTDTTYGGYVATADAAGADVVGFALDAAAAADELVRIAIQ